MTSGIGAVGGGSSASDMQPLTDEQVEALRKNASTSKVLNDARAKAGYLDHDVIVRGDDASYREQLEEFEGRHAIGKADLAAHAFENLSEMAELGGGAGAAPLAFAGVGAGLALYELHEHWLQGRELNETLGKDELHNVMVTTLALPKCFKDEETARRADSSQGFQSGAQRMMTILSSKQGEGIRAVLQLHCDEGMNVALRMTDSGVSKDAFMKSNPALARRYAEDAAFRAGFDGIVKAREWSKEYKDDTFDKTVGDLRARDARYLRASVSFQG